MAKGQSTTAAKPATEDKPKRKVLTPAERIAKIEAELEAAKQKATAKDRKAHAKLTEQRTALVTKQGEINAKLAEINAELEAIEARVPGLGDDSPAPAEPSEG